MCCARTRGETLELVQTVLLVSDIIIVSCADLTWMHFKGSVGKMASMQLQVLPIAYSAPVYTSQSDATANDPLNGPALTVSPKPGFVKI